MSLAFQHRSRQLAVRASVLQVLMRLWRTIDVTRLADTVQPFADAASVVVGEGFTRSARTAAAFYLTSRPRGITRLDIPEVFPAPSELNAARLRGAGLSGIVNGRRAGFSIQAAAQNGFVKVAGTASGLVLSGGRETMLQTARHDPAASGRWQRIAGPNSCPFCQMLADRGPVFSDDTADFSAHDHCGCAAEPEFT
jgi:hypothetical protein